MPARASDLTRLADSFDWDAWTRRIHDAIATGVEAIALEQGDREAEEHGLDFDDADPFLDRWFTTYVGERVAQIDETTRQLLREELQAAFAEGAGGSLQDLAGRIAEAVGGSAAFSPARALTIARTETAIAYNAGALLTYRQNGIDRVEVSDGDGDEECEEADGEIWTLEEALADPVAHPNCVRSFAPVVEDDDAEE